MKKITTFILAAAMTFALAACGTNKDSSTEDGGNTTAYKEAVEVLKDVWGAYGEADKFSIYGGDPENAVMDAPGKFDVAKVNELDTTLGLPGEQSVNVEDAASMVHMMNANTFTGAVYRLKSGTDIEAFSGAVRSNIMNRQWMCGQPEILLIVDVDGTYVLTAFGEAGIMDTFKTNVLSVIDGAEVILEDPIG